MLWGSRFLFGRDGLEQQCPRLAPVALHGSFAHLHDLGNLLDRKPAEKPQFDDACEALVQLG